MSDTDAPQDPKPKSGGAKPAVWIMLLVAAAAVAFYLYRDQNTEPPADIASGGGELEEVAPRPPDLPIFAPEPDDESPLGEPAPKDGDMAATTPKEPATAAPEASPEVTMSAQAPNTDKVLTLSFIEDLAQYLAAGYQPAGTVHNTGSSGTTTVTFKKLNMRYGVDLTGLDVDRNNPVMGRRQALDHLMSPIVLRLAYNLFARDFAQALAGAGEGQTRQFAVSSGFNARKVKPGHVQEMLDIYATQLRDMGRTFEVFASRPELVDLMGRYFAAKQRVNEAYSHYADREAQDAPDAELDRISLNIKQAITEREALKRELLRGTRASEGSSLSEGDRLDIAAWTYRRLSADPEAINAIGALASLSQELADELRRTEP